MNPVATTALSGLMAATARLNASAARIANSGTPGPAPATSDVDLVAEQVEMITARTAFAANLSVLKTADEMERTMLDMKA
jgi:flagellar hook protein FlgE